MATIDKAKIIEAIQQTEDERILFAICRLLQLDEADVPEWHREIVEQRWNEMKEGKAEFVSWEEVKEKVFRKQDVL